MCMQPLFFSIKTLHLGQGLVLTLSQAALRLLLFSVLPSISISHFYSKSHRQGRWASSEHELQKYFMQELHFMLTTDASAFLDLDFISNTSSQSN